MTDKQLKLICKYMETAGWEVPLELGKDVYSGATMPPLDSNLAWEVVQEMERKGEWKRFIGYIFDVYLLEGDEDILLMGMATCLRILDTVTNPTNFFNFFAKWLEEERNNVPNGSKERPWRYYKT